MKGWLGIQKLRLSCHVGACPAERACVQEVVVDLALQIKMPPEDTLSATVDYQTIVGALTKIAQKQAYHLIETLAQALLKPLQADSRIQGVRLRLEKPGALSQAACSFVELSV